MNPFEQYKPTETKHHIVALNAEVTLKTLSLNESMRVDAILYKEGFDDGKPNITMEAIQEAKLLRVSLALVKPKMSVKELKALPKDAMKAIDEIADLLNPAAVEEEGNG